MIDPEKLVERTNIDETGGPDPVSVVVHREDAGFEGAFVERPDKAPRPPLDSFTFE